MRLCVPVALALFCVGWSQAQDSTNTFKVTVDTTYVNLVATGKDGRVLQDLKKEEFVLLENNRPQNITHFFASDSPRAVSLLIDSGCIPEDRMQLFRGEASRFVSLLASRDEVMVVGIGRDFGEEVSLTGDKQQVYTALANLHHRGVPISLHAAVSWTLEKLESRSGNRIAILISDGGIAWRRPSDPKSPSATDVIRKAQRSGVTMYVINFPAIPITVASADRQREPGYGAGVDPSGAQQRTLEEVSPFDRKMELGKVFLRGLADKTGGSFFDLEHRTQKAMSDALRPAFDAIASELKGHYTLAYSPVLKKSGNRRQVKVRVTRPGVKIKAEKKEY